ncbi:MAG TPA: TonB-dependent receptor [Bacteroidales bacterium]|nr:TonB-dependent receptor [Bacteroidales bacterium]HRZ76324.1 TonB-dependent receptor [Bacteroidales bacterium]
MRTLILLPLLFLWSLCNVASAQGLVQTVRGRVVDESTLQPLPGATVVLLGSEPLQGTITDVNGDFRLPEVPVGRRGLRVSYVGYLPQLIENLIVSSARELVVEVRLKAEVISMEAVEVKAEGRRGEALNAMALISARQLGVDEARHYAGGMDDPARLASVFAGVASDLSGNGITVRGNAPRGLLWMLEGVPIPNPNHFANVTALGGGAFTALSSQLLASSDLFTGAFPAEYGNALSGVFDIRMRTGNSERYEHSIQAGVLGIDLASEGPLGKGRGASYLINYRYSTFGILAPLLPENAGNIRYQDLNFKLNLPVGPRAVLTLWGIGSTDHSGADAERDSTRWEYLSDRERGGTVNGFAASGLTLRQNWGSKAYSVSSLAWTGDEIRWNFDRLDQALVLQPVQRIEASNSRAILSTRWNLKAGPGHSLRAGVSAERLGYRYFLQDEAGTTDLVTLADDRGQGWSWQAFVQSRLDLTRRLTLALGLHHHGFSITGARAVEPRASLRWAATSRNAFSLGYGHHSQAEHLPVYLFRDPEGQQPNRKLGLTRARHLVAGYELRITPKLRFMAEPYIQWLYGVPASKDGGYSFINAELEWMIDQPLYNTGTGRNQGLDLTLERFLDRGYHFLFTGTLFDSRYRDEAGVWRSTRFNKGYVLNFLAGREWAVGPKGEDLLGTSLRLNLQGGNWRTPVDVQASLEAGEIVEDGARLFAQQEPGTVHLDLSFNYRNNQARWSGVWSLQLVNILGAEEFYGYRINLKEQRIEEEQEVIILPSLSYRIEF